MQPDSRRLLAAAVLAAGAALAPIAALGEEPAFEVTRVSGFTAATGAYTYADPSHWSRGVMRLQLSAEGRIAGAKWKIGGRADVDPVIDNSGFYLDGVKDDQRRDFFWRETYLDFSAGDWEFRLGAQNIVWGEVVGLFFADVVSPRDLREFVLPSFDILRLPQWAARAEYFTGDSKLEFVWIPVPSFDIIGKPGSDFYPVPLPSPTPQAVADQFGEPLKPSRSVSNSNYGVRATTLIDGWDLSAFYYRSLSTLPTFYRVGPNRFEPRYDRIWQVGSTLSKDLGEAVLRVEAVYAGGRSFATNDPAAPQGVVERNTLDWIVSAEMPFQSVEGRINVQAFQRLYFGSDVDALAIDTGSFGASVLIAAKVTSTLEPSLLWVQGFGGAGAMIRPRLDWYAARNLVLGMGADIFNGNDNGLFGRYGNRDRVYLDVRYDF